MNITMAVQRRLKFQLPHQTACTPSVSVHRYVNASIRLHQQVCYLSVPDRCDPFRWQTDGWQKYDQVETVWANLSSFVITFWPPSTGLSWSPPSPARSLYVLRIADAFKFCWPNFPLTIGLRCLLFIEHDWRTLDVVYMRRVNERYCLTTWIGYVLATTGSTVALGCIGNIN